MTASGVSAYDGFADLPPRVSAAVAAAGRVGFANSCLPEHGRLLQVLAAGVGAGAIGETGTGLGVGLAWLASGAHQAARLTSVEREAERAVAAAEVFAGDPRVRVRTGDWRVLREHGPFDLLVLDGGGHGKGVEPPVDPDGWMRTGGLIVLDDFTPMTSWPPVHRGRPDSARMHWLDHPRLRAAEVRVTPSAAAVVATYLG